MNNNKLIAEFMGIDYVNVDAYQLPYNKDWNWLMPVAEKCLTADEPSDGQHYFINDALLTCNIEVVYDRVVEFIKDHNADSEDDACDMLYGVDNNQ